MALAFDSHGSGPALVLLHGTGSHRGMWDPVVGTLARERRVIAVDLPGFAGSANEHSDPSPAGLTDAMERWFADQGLDRPHVAGNSLGGGIALELARRHAVASATALSPIGFWTPRELAFAQRSLRASRAIVRRLRPAMPALTRTAAGRVALFSQIYGRPWRLPPDDALAALDAFVDGPGLRRGARGRRPLPLRRRRRAARRGGDDRVGHARRAAHPAPGRRGRGGCCRGPSTSRCAGCGHVPCHDDPEAVAAVLLAGSREG